MFNYHYFHPFQQESLRRQFLITGLVLALGISSSLAFEYPGILKTLPWGLFGATIVCSLWVSVRDKQECRDELSG